MPNINDINGVTIANLSKLDGVTKANIAKVLGITLEAAAAFLLDTYTGAAAGYSVRRIASSATNLMRIREDSGDTETDIGYDSNGDLDLAAIASHCGTANGFVVSWVDQSGNGNDADQSTTTSQPKIYDGTTQAVVTENNEPALDFDGTNALNISVTGTVTNFTAFFVRGFATYPNTFQNGFHYKARGIGYNQSGGSGYKIAHLINGTAAVQRADSYPTTTGQSLDYFLNQSELYRNSAAQTLQSGTGYTANTTSVIGGWKESSQNITATIQELIIYESDESSNRTGIETNINSEYLIYQPTDAPTSGLLATYTGAAAAYSVRQLSDKAVIAITVRRDSDDEEKRFGFDSNGDLDSTGIADFCTTANGYVSQWWDQSTNGNHASQGTAASQPQIYNGTAVLTENGKPIIVPSANDTLSTTGIDFTSANTFAFVGTQATGVGVNVLSMDGTPLYVTTSGSTSDCTFGFSPTPVYYHNGTEQTTTPTRGEAYTFLSASQRLLTSVFGDRAGTDVVLGREVGQQMASSQELIIWLTDQESAGNRTGIETDIDNYYAIPGI